MEPLTLHLDTRTGERTCIKESSHLDDKVQPEGVTKEAEEGGPTDTALETLKVEDKPEQTTDASASSVGSRGPILLRRGGPRSQVSSVRKNIVRPNPDVLPTYVSPSKSVDLRSELTTTKSNDRCDNELTGIVRTVEINEGNEPEDENGIDVDFGDATDEPDEMLGFYSDRLTGGTSIPVSLGFNESLKDMEEDRLSLTADDDISIMPSSSKSQAIGKALRQPERNEIPVLSKIPPKPQPYIPAKTSAKQPPPKKQETSTPASSEKTQVQEKAVLKQPPSKPDPSGAQQVKNAPERKSNQQQEKATPPEKNVQPSSFKQDKAVVSEKKSQSFGRSEQPEKNQQPQKGAQSERKPLSSVKSGSAKSSSSTSSLSAKPLPTVCDNCSGIQTMDSRIAAILRQNPVRPLTKEKTETVSQREMELLSNNVVDIARKAYDCKFTSCVPLVLNFLFANGRLSDRHFVDLVPRVAVASGTSLKDFQLHIHPMVENYISETSDTGTLQKLLGLYWYFADWFGLWEIIIRIVSPSSSKSSHSTKIIPTPILRALCRLVLTTSPDRVGIVAWLITKLPKNELTSKFKSQTLIKLLPLLEKRCLYKLRVVLENSLGIKPKLDDLKSKKVHDQMNSLGRRLQNFVVKKQPIGLPNEVRFLEPSSEDIIYQLGSVLRHLSDDSMIDSLATFLTFFSPRTTGEHSELRRLFSGLVFYLVNFIKSKTTIARLVGKLEKVGVEFTQHLNAETLADFNGEGKLYDVSMKMTQAVIDTSAKEIPDLKSRVFTWIVGPSFIPIGKLTNTDELATTVRGKASFFNMLLDKIPENPVSAQVVDYFSHLVQAFKYDFSSENFKEEFKPLYEFEPAFNNLCIACIRSQRTALLNELYEHVECDAIFSKSGGHPSEIVFRLFIAAFALREDRLKAVAAYRLGCKYSVFNVQPDSTDNGCVLIKLPAHFTEPELLTLFFSVFDCAWKLYQEGSFSPTNLPQFAIKIDSPRNDVATENIAILACSQSEEQVFHRIRSALISPSMGLNCLRAPNGLIKMETKDLVSMFGRWKNSTKHPSYPKFDVSADRLMQMARVAGSFKPLVSATGLPERSSATTTSSSPAGAKRPVPTAKTAGPVAPPKVANKGNSPAQPARKPENNTNRDRFTGPKRSHPDQGVNRSPPKNARMSSSSLFSSSNMNRGNANAPSRPPVSGSNGSQQSTQQKAYAIRETEQLFRRVNQYFQEKGSEPSPGQSYGSSSGGPGNRNVAPVSYPPNPHSASAGYAKGGGEPASVNSKLVEAAASAVFAAVRDATTSGPPAPSFGREPGITRAWEEFEERRSGNVHPSEYDNDFNRNFGSPSVGPDNGNYRKMGADAGHSYGTVAQQSYGELHRYPPPPSLNTHGPQQRPHEQYGQQRFQQHEMQPQLKPQHGGYQQQPQQQQKPQRGGYQQQPQQQKPQHGGYQQQQQHGGYQQKPQPQYPMPPPLTGQPNQGPADSYSRNPYEAATRAQQQQPAQRYFNSADAPGATGYGNAPRHGIAGGGSNDQFSQHRQMQPQQQQQQQQQLPQWGGYGSGTW